MNISYNGIKNILYKYVLIVKESRFSILLYLLLYLAIFVTYFRSLFNIGNLDFPDLGVFPLYPGQILQQNLFYWQNGNFGSPGSILPYSYIIYFLEHLFNVPAIAERVWITSFLPIASLSIFYIAYYKINLKLFHSLIFAFLYAFNPVTTGLFYMGSVNDTLTMYIFEPILITLLYCIISSETYLKVIQWSLMFILMFYYVYSWSPEIVMWTLPLFFISFILMGINKIRNVVNLSIASVGILFSMISVIIVTGNIPTVFTLLSGNGNNTFVISGGTANVSELVINLTDNFTGQLSYNYAIIAFFLSTLSLLLFVKVKNFLSPYMKTLYLSNVIFILIILSIWTIFHLSITPLETSIVSYIPEIAAYEPFMGITLLFCLFFFNFMILCEGFVDMEQNKKKKERILRIANTPSRRRIIELVVIFIVTFILFSSSVNYWRHDVPSTIDQLMNSNLAFDQYAVPNDYKNMSTWLNAHLSNTGGRYMLLPYGGMSNEAISTFIPEISSINLPLSTWNIILSSINTNHTFKSFSQELSLLGVKYIVINKGPYVAGDAISSFSGKERIYAAGFPWDLTYLPAGYWQNWSSLFKNDSFLKPVLNNGNWLVLRNTFFTGLFHVYSFPHNFDTTNISGIQKNGNITYFGIGSKMQLNFSIPQHNAFAENWSKTIYKNGSVYYNGSTLPSNMSYSNIWDMVSLKNSTFYDLNYSITGINMSAATVDVRFYSGHNMSGNVLSTQKSYPEGGNLTKDSFNFIFETPQSFNSSAIFLTYQANIHVKSYLYSFHINSFRYENESSPLSGPSILAYSYINPTKLILDLNLIGNHTFLILYSSTYNSAWNLNANNKTFNSKPLNVFSYLEFNSFFVNESVSHTIISFKLQDSYNAENTSEMLALLLYVSSLPPVILINIRRKWNVQG